MKKILFYTNQYFGRIGGEAEAGTPPQLRNEPVGPALAFQPLLAGEIVASIICGDNYANENSAAVKTAIADWIAELKPDLFLAGPAFNAGRFGMACGDLGSWVHERFGIPALSGMFIENPAVEIYKDKILIAATGPNAASIRRAVPAMAHLANKLLRGQELQLPEQDGYIARGIRVNIFHERNGAERALDMLMHKLKGEPYQTEIPIPVYTRVEPAAPIARLKEATIALISSGGIVPFGNPDRLPAATAKFYKAYDISDLPRLETGGFESVHAGYDPVYANADPNRVAPLDALRQLEQQGVIGRLHPELISTTGNSTSVADATRMGGEIAARLRDANVDGAIVTST